MEAHLNQNLNQRHEAVEIIEDMRDASPSMENLDDDSLICIFKHLNLCDRVTIQSVCKKWQDLSSYIWKDCRAIDVCDEEHGFGSIAKDEINFSVCTRIFESSLSRLTKVNFTWTRGPRNFAIIDLCQCCPLEENQSSPKTLNNLIRSLSSCENIEELALCRCVIEVNEDDLIQIFRNNRKLRTLLLSKYRLLGKCLFILPLQTLESIVLCDCAIDFQYLNLFIHRAPKLHTLGIKNCISGLEELELEFSPQLSSKLKRLDLDDLPPFPGLISDICNLKNLTILNLQSAILEDYQLRAIVKSCKKLVALDISEGTFLTDASLCDLRFLPQLKCLNLGLNDDFSNGGLQYLSENLRELRVAMSEFSETALLKALRRMHNLEVLDVSFCEHLKNRFVQTVIDIVKNRSNKVPLKIGLAGTGAQSEKIQNDCPRVEFHWDGHFWPDYNQYL